MDVDSSIASCLVLAGVTALMADVQTAVGQTATGKTPADWPAGMTAPVAVSLPSGDWASAGLTGVVSLRGAKESKRVAAQFEPANPDAGTPARAWIMWAAGPVDRNKAIAVTFEKSPAGKPLYQTLYADPLLKISWEGVPILTYHHGRPEAGQRYPFNDFIHPLLGLDGEPLTALRPQDHEHHRGVFWAWVRHQEDGKAMGDWWLPSEIRLDAGALHHVDGPLFSVFTAEHTWVYVPKTGHPERFMNEQVVCRVFPTTRLGRAVDIDVSLIPLVDRLRIGGTIEHEKGYGGFTFRYGQAREAAIVADGKRVTKDVNQLRAAWADYSGLFLRRPGQPNHERTGAAVFVDPHHPDFPPEWITRLYGCLHVSYPGLRTLDLAKGQPLRLHYRLWIHRGGAAEGEVDNAYKAFSAEWQWQFVTATQTAPAR